MNRRKTSNKGILFVVSAPSGAGKTTVVERLLRKDRRLSKTVSHTTRPPRPGERHGRDYFFVTDKAFRKMAARKGFVEWARVYGNRYGTSHGAIRKSLRGGKDVVLVIESRGARAIRRKYKGSVFILILPPSVAELRRRISARPGSTPETVRVRLRAAAKEVEKMRWYHYAIVNDRLSRAVEDLRAVILAERRKQSRRS